MAFSWEPFGRTHSEEPATPQEAEPAPARTSAPTLPARRLAVLTCMDARIDPLRAFGLRLGDAVILRNAGAQASDDVLRSLKLAHEALGVAAVTVIGHTDCAGHGRDDNAAAVAAERAAARVRSAVPGLRVDAAMLDIETGSISRRGAAPLPSD
ncbi:MAG TPA: carbonic anhydrase [Solirubrobacteraceae bacterium]|nr:carbonic anhydrase [Solirubrobacteraceae bacterium]